MSKTVRLRCSHSDRQLVTIRDFAKDKMTVHSGPFGVGKTRALIEAFGLYCQRLQRLGTTDLTFVLAGKTQQAVKRNMCNVLAQLFGKDFKYFKGNKDGKDRDAIIFGQNLYVIGFNDASSREKFQGITEIMGVLHDESTLCTQDQFDYMQGRLRGEVNIEGEGEDEDGIYIDIIVDKDSENLLDLEGLMIPKGTTAMWYCGSCNPDVPTHFIKKYIDEGIIINKKWYMRDALWKGALAYYSKLQKQYKDNQSFYSRYLLGKWTSADRMVYPMFVYKKHILDTKDIEIDYSKMKDIILGLDYGTDHPTALCLVCVTWSGEYIVTRTQTMRNTAPSDIVHEVAKMFDFVQNKKASIRTVYVDPSATALKTEMTKQRISFTNAINNHEEGISILRNLLSLEQSLIMSSCDDLIGEIYSYRFKDTNNGKDEIYKVGDDIVDAWRYAVASHYKLG